MKDKEAGKSSGGADGDADDDAEANPDMALFGNNKHGGKKRKGNFSHNKGFANKSFARKRKRVN